MTGLSRFFGYTAALSLFYFLSLFHFIKIPLIDRSTCDIALPFIPWWLLVSFGSYSLASIGFGLFTFKDCPDAYTELLTEISQAKDHLRSKGVHVD